MVAASALVAVSLLVGGNRILLDNLTATDSGTRFRAAYALAHTHDPSSSNEAAAVKQLLIAGIPGEQAAAGEGIEHRRWPEGHIPDTLADSLYPAAIRRDPAPRTFELRGVGRMPPVQDGLRLLSTDKARTVFKRKPLADEKAYQLWLRRDDKALQRGEIESSGDWDHRKLAFASKPMSRPPCIRECIFELMYFSWLGMDMTAALEVRKPPTTEVDWWTETLFRLVRAAAGDESTLDALVSDASAIVDVDSRSALFAALVLMPPGVEIHRKVRPLVPRAAMDRDPMLRRYAIELLSVRRELDGIAGAEEAFAAALSDPDPDVRVRAACELWDLRTRSSATTEKMKAALAKEPDPVVGEVLRQALAAS